MWMCISLAIINMSCSVVTMKDEVAFLLWLASFLMTFTGYSGKVQSSVLTTRNNVYINTAVLQPMMRRRPNGRTLGSVSAKF